jgi:folate-binding protein YgfZ
MNFCMPTADADALTQNAVAVPLLHLGLIRATGVDAAIFLHRLFSNDVTGLAKDAVQWTSFNTAQGRMLANFLLWHDDGGLCLAASADLVPTLLKKLSFYILRAKVKLALPEQERVLIGLAGPRAGEHLARTAPPMPETDMRQAVSADRRTIRLHDGLFILDLPAAEAPAAFDSLRQSGVRPGGTASWQLTTIRTGLPLITAATQEAFVAQMLNFEIIGGVSFTKGCYPGQEIIARTQHLGKPKRRMFRIGLPSLPSAADVPAGTALYSPASESADGQTAGIIVNFAPLPNGGEALAVIRVEHAQAGDEIRIGAPDGPCVQVLELPYEVPEKSPPLTKGKGRGAALGD